MKNLNFVVTINELAKICNVSPGTVDRALNNRVGISKKTKEKILLVAKEYGYIKETEKKPKLIGIVLFDLYNEFFSELVMHFEDETKKNGYSLVVMFTDKDCKKEIDCIKYLYYMGVNGIVLCPINQGEEFEKFISSLKIPIITVGNRINNIPYIGIDNEKAMFDAAKFLSNKYKHIFYFSPPIKSKNNTYAQDERLKGFKKACLEVNIMLNIMTDMNNLENSIKKYAPNECAILCSSDIYLISLLAKYPDITLMGFDNIRTLKYFNNNFATVDTGSADVARETVKSIKEGNVSDIITEYKIISQIK